ncbi:MAG: ComEC/Rec2 family competence protein [Xanthobacteraceae bacterium]
MLLCAAVACLGMTLRSVWRFGLAALVLGGALASLALGLAAGKIASDLNAAPVLGQEMRAARVTGWVELIEPWATGGERITLATAAIEGLAPENTPQRVRVRVPASDQRLAPGQSVRVEASLLPPAGPALPGAFDFARSAWFMRLGAVGSAKAPPVPVDLGQSPPLRLALWMPIERLRQRISRRITMTLPGETGAIAAALVTGERGGITETTNQAYRDSGIFHILSISGLHMSIFAGALYVACRFLLSLVPMLVLRFEVKKWAAVVGLIGTAGYLVISGGTPPAVRSAIMISIMFIAILLDRPALALRNVAIAALIILVLTPQSLIDVGFQMSFAAVVALISGAEAWQAWQRSRGHSRQASAFPFSSAIGFFGTIVLTTLIATAAVAPFAAYHFHKSTQFAVLANLAAVPICNLLVMPAALATLIAMPAGLEAFPLWAMGAGIDAMSWVAARVATLPGAVALVPAIPTLAFALMVGGGLWLCLWGRRWRLLGLLPILAGLTLAPTRGVPDILIGADGSLIGVRGPDGKLAVLGAKRSSFELARWLEHDADSRTPTEVGLGRVIRCDDVGCGATTASAQIAIARHPAALADDCDRADLIIWMGDGIPTCDGEGRIRIIPRETIARDGTHAMFVRPAAGSAPPTGREIPAAARADGSNSRSPTQAASADTYPSARAASLRPTFTIETVAEWRGHRPWAAPHDTSHRRSHWSRTTR